MDELGSGPIWAVVAAAGESRRMGLPEGESKQFLRLAGEPILCHSVRRLLAIERVAGVVVVLHPSHTVRFANEVLCLEEGKPIVIAEGGRERSDSIRAGLMDVPPSAAIIAVHDGARPLFSKRVFAECVAALEHADGAIPAYPVNDTLKRASEDGVVRETVDRSGL